MGCVQVEKLHVLNTKGRGRNKQNFVKSVHWSTKFNSWINAGDRSLFIFSACSVFRYVLRIQMCIVYFIDVALKSFCWEISKHEKVVLQVCFEGILKEIL